MPYLGLRAGCHLQPSRVGGWAGRWGACVHITVRAGDWGLGQWVLHYQRTPERETTTNINGMYKVRACGPEGVVHSASRPLQVRLVILWH
jgi:hypothetical protein